MFLAIEFLLKAEFLLPGTKPKTFRVEGKHNLSLPYKC